MPFFEKGVLRRKTMIMTYSSPNSSLFSDHRVSRDGISFAPLFHRLQQPSAAFHLATKFHERLSELSRIGIAKRQKFEKAFLGEFLI